MSFKASDPGLPPPPRIWRFGNAEFDEGRRELRVDGNPSAAEAKPLAILQELLSQRGDVVTKDELKAAVWPGVEVVEQSLTTAISKLRAALGDDDWSVVRVVRGKGYQIGVPITVRAGIEPDRPTVALHEGAVVPNRAHWRLERPLGSGAIQDVWLACHDKTSERRVFKFADTTQRLEALKREVALSRILHSALGDRPDFVQVSDWNFDASPFFIESSFGGPNLADWAAAQGGLIALPLPERIAIVAQIAHIVSAAHTVGVLHQDIKPANILVDEQDGERVIRLVDFGSGRLTDAARLASVTISGIGLDDSAAGQSRASGTWHYVAPEVLTGGASTIAADLYALGILLYQMLAGDLSRPLTAGWEADVADPELRADITDTANVEPARRLSSAEALAERLEALEQRRAERRLKAQQAAEHDQLLRTAEIRRVEAAAAAQRAEHATNLARRTRHVAIVLTLLLGVVTGLSLYAFQQRQIAVAQQNRATQITEAARDAVTSLVNDIATSIRDQAGVSMNMVQQLLGGAETIVTRLARLAPDDTELSRLSARASAEFADTYLHQGDLAKALDAGQRAVALQQALLVGQPGNAMLRRELAQSLRWVGDVRLKQRDFADALATYSAAAGVMAQLAAADPQNPDFQQRLARAELAVGDVQLAQGNNQGALATYRQAQAIIVRGLTSHQADPAWQLDLSTTEEKVGDALEALGDRAGALAAYQADLAIRQRLVSLDSTNTRWERDLAIANSDVGNEWALLGKPAEALKSYEVASTMLRALAASDVSNTQYQRDVADNDNDIGNVEADVGDQPAAAKSFGAGVAIMKELVASSPTDVGFQRDLVALETGLAKSLIKNGDVAAAAIYASEAVEAAKDLAGAHPLDPALADGLAAAEALALRTNGSP